MKISLIPYINENRQQTNNELQSGRIILQQNSISSLSIDAIHTLKMLKENDCECADRLKMSISETRTLFANLISETSNLKLQLLYTRQIEALTDIQDIISKITS